ncbi:unnamed protein product, partial [marine sediment metagenome]
VDLHMHSSLLVKKIAEVLRRHNPDIILDICDFILGNDKYKKYFFRFDFLFSIVLTKEMIGRTLEKLKNLQYVDNSLFRALCLAKDKRGEEGNKIYEEGRKYLANIYKQSEEEMAKSAIAPSEGERIHKEFIFRLEPEKDNYSQDVFQYFAENYELLKDNLTKQNLSCIKKLTTDILKKVNPQEGEFKAVQWDAENKNIVRFQISSFLPLFEDCLKVADILKIAIDKDMRKNMINFIPFARYEGLDNILKIVTDIKNSE